MPFRVNRWEEEAEVLIVGYGGAGAVAAVMAHDAGAKVLILEKQPSDKPTETRHTPSTRMSGGAWYHPTEAESAFKYMKAMSKVANEALDRNRLRMLRLFSQRLVECTDWMRDMGANIGTAENAAISMARAMAGNVEMKNERLMVADFPELPGSGDAAVSFVAANGKYRHGSAYFKVLEEAVKKRGIPVLWETPAKHLVTERERVCGVRATRGHKEIAIRASRAVVLTCGGFEFNEWMKENYLRVNPVYFYGNPGNTGDGVSMAMELGASLWHMNATSWRVSMIFPGHPHPFCTQYHETGTIFIDRYGRRFTNERYKMHAFGYELTNYDTHALCYPKVPFYWVFNERRRAMAPLASQHGACNPPGGIMGDIHYIWSHDNQREIDRGWIIKANSIEELASKLRKEPDNGGLMGTATLKATLKRYNSLCEKGKDSDFNKGKEWLEVMEPPFYAVKLWPGGPNTQGGPRRNERGQVLRLDNRPIPGLYSAGELGSIWGMLYQSGGNISENMIFGRISGANAAAEVRR